MLEFPVTLEAPAMLGPQLPEVFSCCCRSQQKRTYILFFPKLLKSTRALYCHNPTTAHLAKAIWKCSFHAFGPATEWRIQNKYRAKSQQTNCWHRYVYVLDTGWVLLLGYLQNIRVQVKRRAYSKRFWCLESSGDGENQIMDYLKIRQKILIN